MVRFFVVATFMALTSIGCGGGGGGGGGSSDQVNPDPPGATSFEVTVTTSDGGSASDDMLIIDSGQTTSITLTPDENHIIDSASGCSGALDGNTYNTGAISSDCTVNVEFSLEPLVKASFLIDAPVDYIESVSEGFDVQIVLPVDLNDDNYKDFIVHYWGSAAWGEDRGTYVDVPTPDALVAFMSDEDGNYTVANELVFGTQIAKLGGASRKYARKDINGDGLDEFAFAMNWEDGRSGEIAPTLNTEQVLLISNNDKTYELLKFYPTNWGHSVGIIEIDEGVNDVLFAGFTNGAHLYRYSSGRFQEVTRQYPDGANDWAVAFTTMPGDGNSDDIISTGDRRDENGDQIGSDIIRYKYAQGDWRETASFSLPVDLRAQFSSHQNTVIEQAVARLDGTQYVGGNFFEFCTMPSLQDEEHTLLVARFAGSKLKSGENFREGIVYDPDELADFRTFVFFQLDGEEIRLIDSPLVGETLTSDGNFFDCMDINNDGLTDLAFYRFSSAFFGDDQFGKPDVYLNDGDGKLVLRDLSELDDFLPSASYSSSKFTDIDGDGILDLVFMASGLTLEEARLKVLLLSRNL